MQPHRQPRASVCAPVYVRVCVHVCAFERANWRLISLLRLEETMKSVHFPLVQQRMFGDNLDTTYTDYPGSQHIQRTRDLRQISSEYISFHLDKPILQNIYLLHSLCVHTCIQHIQPTNIFAALKVSASLSMLLAHSIQHREYKQVKNR